MASVADMQLQVDVRLGLDGPAGECVGMLREFYARADARTIHRQCLIAGDGWCIAHNSIGPCLVGRAKAFLDAIDNATDPKGVGA